MPRPPVVLVIEDQDELGRVIRDILGKEGYDVVAVATAVEALEILRGQRVDLLVSDLPSGNESDDDALAPILEEFAELRVIVIKESDEAVPFFGPWRVSGSQLTLRRPFRLDDLVAAPHEVIG